jgi:hypothetical protein
VIILPDQEIPIKIPLKKIVSEAHRTETKQEISIRQKIEENLVVKLKQAQDFTFPL